MRTLSEINHNGDIGSEFGQHLRETKLFETRSLFLCEAVTPSSAYCIVSDLILLDQIEKKPIYLYLNSPGGEVNSGLSIFDTIRFIDSEVKIITLGLCASIATIINVAVPKKQRYALPHSKFLIHQPLISGMVQGPASDLEITAKQILKTQERINKLLAKECGQDVKRVSEDTLRDYWMDAEEAIEYGLIGKIISHKKELK